MKRLQHMTPSIVTLRRPNRAYNLRSALTNSSISERQVAEVLVCKQSRYAASQLIGKTG